MLTTGYCEEIWNGDWRKITLLPTTQNIWFINLTKPVQPTVESKPLDLIIWFDGLIKVTLYNVIKTEEIERTLAACVPLVSQTCPSVCRKWVLGCPFQQQPRYQRWLPVLVKVAVQDISISNSLIWNQNTLRQNITFSTKMSKQRCKSMIAAERVWHWNVGFVLFLEKILMLFYFQFNHLHIPH